MRLVRIRDYRGGMNEVKPDDLLVSTEEEVEVDAETAVAIDRDIRAADEGRTGSLDELWKMIPEWISKFEPRKRRFVDFETVLHFWHGSRRIPRF